MEKPSSGIAQAIRIGDLDRQIVLQTNTPTRGDSGSVVDSWGTFANCWAKVEEMNAGSGEEEARKKQTAVTRFFFTIRFRSGVTTLLRVSYKGLFFDIKSVSEIGRKQFLRLEAEARN
jgi:SPP1 family predicted phage head-tail adaptor